MVRFSTHYVLQVKRYCLHSLHISKDSLDKFVAKFSTFFPQRDHIIVLIQHFWTSHIQNIQREHVPNSTQKHRKHKCILRFTSSFPTNLIVIRFVKCNEILSPIHACRVSFWRRRFHYRGTATNTRECAITLWGKIAETGSKLYWTKAKKK